MEQARALLRQADDLLCQAAELDLARNQILTRARALARAMGLRKPLRSALSRKTGRPRVPVTRVGRLFQKARSLAETRESILNQANALWAQAQYLMSKHGYR